jgi:hypothetical protein
MNPETRLVWQPLKKELDRLKYHYVRLENRQSGPGTPDLNVHFPRIGDVWIELKYAKIDSEGYVDLGLRPEQYVWMYKASTSGRRVYLVARVNDQWYVWKDFSVWKLAKKRAYWHSDVFMCNQYFTGPAHVLKHLGYSIPSQ